MMSYDEDHIAMAAEYVLGTLDGEERAQVEMMMSVDPEFKLVVEQWEQARRAARHGRRGGARR